MSRRAVLLAVVATVGLAVAPAGADPLPAPSVALAGPGAFAAGYATRVVVVVEGQSLQLVSLDAAPHNLTSLATIPKRVKIGKRYRTVRVPLFASGDVQLVGTSEVLGVSRLKPGSYAFKCTVHPTSMTGQLQVIDAP